MVAPHETGDLVRSLVRVPHSGQDRTLASVCLDLGKVSTIAGSVPVPTSLPPVLARPLQPRQLNRTETKVKLEPSPSGATSQHLKKEEHLKRSNGSAHDENRHPKRPRVVTGQCLMVIATTGPLLVHAGQENQPQLSIQVNAPAGPVEVNEGTPSVSQLRQELSSLQSENASLNERIRLFQQLFRDKKKLTSVLHRLGVNTR
ncbi:uncharacterized protein [Palaemon carinicauda]|uniref:uncharacterized protein n=1 Tax=Palaemon carinicauda TaxID=392227 RepID=UPI0035B684D7